MLNINKIEIMATAKNSTSAKETSSSKGNFANMDKDKLKETASKGGKANGSASKSHK